MINRIIRVIPNWAAFMFVCVVVLLIVFTSFSNGPLMNNLSASSSNFPKTSQLKNTEFGFSLSSSVTYKLPETSYSAKLIKSETKKNVVSISNSSFNSKITALSIGDILPDIEFTMVNYEGKRNVRLSDFKGKIVILDFWATWCSSCIAKFPMLDSIQDLYKDQLQIILVNSSNTGDNENKVKSFFEKWEKKFGQPLKLATAVEDKAATMFFPHTTVPHYAWITPQGFLETKEKNPVSETPFINSRMDKDSLAKMTLNDSHIFFSNVNAITDSKEINLTNIKKAVKKHFIEFREKKDFFPNKTLDFGNGEQLITDNFPLYSNFHRGTLMDQTTLNQTRLVKSDAGNNFDVRGVALRNIGLLDMYKAAIRYNLKFRSSFTDLRLFLETPDSSELIFDSTRSNTKKWEKENLYTYDLVVPPGKSDSLYFYMISDLNKYSEFSGEIIKRKVKCFTLIRTSSVDKLRTKGGDTEFSIYRELPKKYVNNISVNQFLWRLELLQLFDLPLIDDTGYVENIDLDLSVDNLDSNSILKKLNQYDLDLVQTEREIDVFVLKKK